MLYEKILSESHRLDEQINTLKQKIAGLPDGNVFCIHDSDQVKWYQSLNHKQIYISKKNRLLVKQLTTKKLLSLLLKDCLNEKRALDFYLRHHDKNAGQAALKLATIPEYKEFLQPLFKPFSQELYEWTKEPYTTNTQYPEQLVHKASSGIMVRSKSEAIIDMLLSLNKIPFRYECALTLDETTLFPDFTIRHPLTGKTYYWEHFGLMDNPAYSKNAFAKMQLYTSHQIFPGILLITTYESQKNPLSIDTVQKIIEQYFL